MSGLPNDAYGRTVVLQSDNVTYIVTNPDETTFSVEFPLDTPLTQVYGVIDSMAPSTLPLSQAIVFNLSQARDSLQAFVESRYSLDIQNSFRIIYTLAVINSLTNRAAYCLQIITWGQLCVSYAATYISTVKSMTDPTTVAATFPDFSALVAADPLVTPIAALAILN